MPLDTLAREAAWKVTGRERYDGIEPVALVLGWTFEPQSWMGRPAVLVGSGLGAAIGLPPGATHASFQDLVRNPALFVRSMLIVAAIEGRFLACGFQAHAASRGKFGAAPARLLRGRLSGAEKSARGRPAAFAPPDRFRPATSGPSGLRTRWQGTCSPSSGDAHAERIAQGDSGEPSLTSGPGPEQLERLLSCSRDRIFGTGDFLCREGEPADSFFLIWEGRASLEAHVVRHGGLRIETVHPAEVLGWSWMVPPHRRPLDARAIEPVEPARLGSDPIREKKSAGTSQPEPRRRN